MNKVTLDDLRRFAVGRSLFKPTTLAAAVARMEFVQADPIRAPARAQDLTLRPRVDGYRAGDLEREFASLDLEEDFFINHGFVTGRVYRLMHPRSGLPRWSPARSRRATAILAFARERGELHPRDAEAEFAHGKVTNAWGGTSRATTDLLQSMHYRGLLRVTRRERGVRLYAASDQKAAATSPNRDHAIDELIDVVVRLYAPLPAASLSMVIHRVRWGAPQWHRQIKEAVRRTKQRLAHAKVAGTDWYWPAGEDPRDAPTTDAVRLLGPFDPVVWDRRRFELLWNWAYRFEAYTPAAKRVRGYYALPLLWRDRVVGWANVSARSGEVVADFGYVAGRPPRDRGFKQALATDLENLTAFLDNA